MDLSKKLRKLKTIFHSRGFTMIELMVVVSIITIMSSLAYTNFNNARNKGRDEQRKQNLKAISAALVSYYQDNDEFPPVCNPSPCTGPSQYTSDGSAPWIPDLTSQYMQTIPQDPKQASLITQLAQLMPSLQITEKTENQPQVAASSSDSTLVAAYSFDEGSGTTVNDISQYNNDGTINGATWTTGKYGNGLSFDGSNDYVQIPNSSSLNIGGNQLTLEAWVIAGADVRNAVAKPVNASSHTSPYFAYAFNAVSGIRPRFYITTGGSAKTALGTTVLAPNTWYHLAGVYNGSTMKLYVNGIQQASTNVTGNLNTYSTPLRIGINGGLGEAWSGKIDEVIIYNRALSVAEIQSDMNTALGGGPPPTYPSYPSYPTYAPTYPSYPSYPTYAPTYPSYPTYVPSYPSYPGSPPAGIPGNCLNKNGVYCYLVSQDRQSFILWAQLDRTNDPEAFGQSDTKCNYQPPATGWNYCVESPK